MFFKHQSIMIDRVCSVLEGHKDIIFDATFSEHAKNLYSCSADGSVIMWDWKRGILNKKKNDMLRFLRKEEKNDSFVFQL